MNETEHRKVREKINKGKRTNKSIVSPFKCLDRSEEIVLAAGGLVPCDVTRKGNTTQKTQSITGGWLEQKEAYKVQGEGVGMSCDNQISMNS